MEGRALHHGPLSASLMAEYGIDLDNPGVSEVRLADLVANLPAGCAFWQSIGGPMAWSEQIHLLHVLEFRARETQWLNANKSGPRPEPFKPPPFAGQVRDDQSRMEDKARRFRERFG